MIIIDRLGKWAVIEYGDNFHFQRELLPEGAKEGDVLNITVGL